MIPSPAGTPLRGGPGSAAISPQRAAAIALSLADWNSPTSGSPATTAAAATSPRGSDDVLTGESYRQGLEAKPVIRRAASARGPEALRHSSPDAAVTRQPLSDGLGPAATSLLRLAGFAPDGRIISPATTPFNGEVGDGEEPTGDRTSGGSGGRDDPHFPFSYDLVVAVALAHTGQIERLCAQTAAAGGLARRLRKENQLLHSVVVRVQQAARKRQDTAAATLSKLESALSREQRRATRWKLRALRSEDDARVARSTAYEMHAAAVSLAELAASAGVSNVWVPSVPDFSPPPTSRVASGPPSGLPIGSSSESSSRHWRHKPRPPIPVPTLATAVHVPDQRRSPLTAAEAPLPSRDQREKSRHKEGGQGSWGDVRFAEVHQQNQNGATRDASTRPASKEPSSKHRESSRSEHAPSHRHRVHNDFPNPDRHDSPGALPVSGAASSDDDHDHHRHRGSDSLLHNRSEKSGQPSAPHSPPQLPLSPSPSASSFEADSWRGADDDSDDSQVPAPVLSREFHRKKSLYEASSLMAAIRSQADDDNDVDAEEDARRAEPQRPAQRDRAPLASEARESRQLKAGSSGTRAGAVTAAIRATTSEDSSGRSSLRETQRPATSAVGARQPSSSELAASRREPTIERPSHAEPAQTRRQPPPDSRTNQSGQSTHRMTTPRTSRQDGPAPEATRRQQPAGTPSSPTTGVAGIVARRLGRSTNGSTPRPATAAPRLTVSSPAGVSQPRGVTERRAPRPTKTSSTTPSDAFRMPSPPSLAKFTRGKLG